MTVSVQSVSLFVTYLQQQKTKKQQQQTNKKPGKVFDFGNNTSLGTFTSSNQCWFNTLISTLKI